MHLNKIYPLPTLDVGMRNRNFILFKGLKVNSRKTKLMVSESHGKLLGVCGRRVMANSVLCTKCGNWFMANVQK